MAFHDVAQLFCLLFADFFVRPVEGIDDEGHPFLFLYILQEQYLSEAVAVSYTHLDVYKRQVLLCMGTAVHTREQHVLGVFVLPYDNAAEGSVVQGIEVYPVRTARELVESLTGGQPLPTDVYKRQG